MIFSSNVVAIARLVILARKDQGQEVHYIFYFHATRILLTGLTKWMSKIPHQKALIYSIDISDTVKAISIEKRLKFPQVN